MLHYSAKSLYSTVCYIIACRIILYDVVSEGLSSSSSGQTFRRGFVFHLRDRRSNMVVCPSFIINIEGTHIVPQSKEAHLRNYRRRSSNILSCSLVGNEDRRQKAIISSSSAPRNRFFDSE